MTSKHSEALRLTALLLVLAITQVYVLAHPSGVILGRLTTSADNVINVNNNGASSGTTILSGAQIQTPAEAGATVDISPAGRLEIAPNTSLSLNFNAGSVEVNVASGGALLTTYKGVAGAITLNGVTERTDPSKDSSTVNVGPDPDPKGGSTGNGPSFGHIFAIGLPIIVGSILLAIYVPCRRPNNPSPTSTTSQCRRGI